MGKSVRVMAQVKAYYLYRFCKQRNLSFYTNEDWLLYSEKSIKYRNMMYPRGFNAGEKVHKVVEKYGYDLIEAWRIFDKTVNQVNGVVKIDYICEETGFERPKVIDMKMIEDAFERFMGRKVC